VGEREIPPCVLLFEDAIALISNIARPIVLAGTAATRAHARLPDTELSNVLQPDALWVALLAQGLSVPDVPPRPLYLRPPDAKLPVRK
jgi:tRNA threonylcarbamoyladenosine biosynthesis protein TsaB